MPKKITLIDIAAECGVSKNTVSLALKNSPRVKKSTSELVLKTAAKMGYEPDPKLARLMTQLVERRQLNETIKEEVAYLESIRPATEGTRTETGPPAHEDFFEGASQFLESKGYRLSCFYYWEASSRYSQLNRIFASRGIRGVIAGPLPHTLDSIEIDWSRLTGVSLGRRLKKPSLNRIDINHANHCRLCFSHLRKRGHTRIGLSMPRLYDVSLEHTLRSVYLGQVAIDPDAESIPVLDANFPIAHNLGTEEALEWIRKHKVQAAICIPEELATFQECKDKYKLQIDIAVTLLRAAGTQMGVRENGVAVGRVAAQQLVADLNFGHYAAPEHPQLTQITGEWFEAED